VSSYFSTNPSQVFCEIVRVLHSPTDPSHHHPSRLEVDQGATRDFSALPRPSSGSSLRSIAFDDMNSSMNESYNHSSNEIISSTPASAPSLAVRDPSLQRRRKELNMSVLGEMRAYGPSTTTSRATPPHAYSSSPAPLTLPLRSNKKGPSLQSLALMQESYYQTAAGVSASFSKFY
jgi:hypothetical protein